MEPREIKRQEAIHEVIESEAFYLKDLALTYRVNNNNRKKERSLVERGFARGIFGHINSIG